MCRVLDSLFVVHNILHTLGDYPDNIDDVDLNEIMRAQHEVDPQAPLQPTIVDERTPEQHRVVGYERRLQLLDYWNENSL